MASADKGVLATPSGMDEIDNLYHISVQPVEFDPPQDQKNESAKQKNASSSNLLPSGTLSSAPVGFGGAPTTNTLNEPVGETLKRDIGRIISNLQVVVFPNPYRKDLGKALREWDLWGPFFFIIFLALVLSSGSPSKSAVFAIVFGTLSLGAIVLTLNVLLLGGKIIFFQSLSVLGYCLFPLDIAAIICLFIHNKFLRTLIIGITLAWSSWAAYPFISGSVSASRRALAVYPLLLLFTSVGFLVLAND